MNIYLQDGIAQNTQGPGLICANEKLICMTANQTDIINVYICVFECIYICV